MNLYETCHARGERIEVHRHERPYAAFVLEGAYEEAGPDGAWRLEAGDLILHPPFHLHLNRFEHASARVLNVTLDHRTVCGIGLRDYAVLRPKAPGQLLRGLGRDATDALGAAIEDSAYCEASAPSHWLDIFASDLSDKPYAPIAALARESGITPTHAARAFARRYGQTPVVFRKERRLRLALQALAQTALPLAQIAVQAGYADQAHMTRALKASTGMTPSALRCVLRQVDFVQDEH